MNNYLHEVAGDEFTAKDFRTWAGTRLAAEALNKCGRATSRRQAMRNIKHVVEQVAQTLGNTAAVCKKCYIHPEVFERYLETNRGQ